MSVAKKRARVVSELPHSSVAVTVTRPHTSEQPAGVPSRGPNGPASISYVILFIRVH